MYSGDALYSQHASGRREFEQRFMALPVAPRQCEHGNNVHRCQNPAGVLITSESGRDSAVCFPCLPSAAARLVSGQSFIVTRL